MDIPRGCLMYCSNEPDPGKQNESAVPVPYTVGETYDTGYYNNDNGIFRVQDRPLDQCNTTGKAIGSFKLQTQDDPLEFRYTYNCRNIGDNDKNNQSTSHTTTINDSGGGSVVFLDRHDVKCPDNQVMSNLTLKSNDDNSSVWYEYDCKNVNATTCETYTTTFAPSGGGAIEYLDRHHVNCPNDKALNQFRLKRDQDGTNYRYEYTCCGN